MSWNLEGLDRNVHSLKHFIESFSPSLVFLSEPQVFDCDISMLLQNMSPLFSFSLNSECKFNDSLALIKRKAKGGTLLMWPATLDPYITILPTSSPALLPCMVKLPGCVTSYHIGIYMPTAGKDDDFVNVLSSLDLLLTDIYEKHDGKYPIFIRGDCNVSSKNTVRSNLLAHFLLKHNLLRVEIPHKTYHHFVGNGLFDSDLDLLLFSNTPGCSEELTKVVCKLDNPLINSLHDIVLSKFTLPPAPPPPPPSQENLTAPRIPNTRQKVLWSVEGIAEYQSAVGVELERLRDTWGESSTTSPSSMAVLLSSTYSLLNTAAAATNQVIKLVFPSSLGRAKFQSCSGNFYVLAETSAKLRPLWPGLPTQLCHTPVLRQLSQL